MRCTDVKTGIEKDMKHAIVLGIGNRLMGDDGIGVSLVETLGRDLASERVSFKAGETDADYCLDVLSGNDCCIIIDGACTGREPFTVDVRDLKDVLKERRPVSSFHDFDLIYAIKREKVIMRGILITVEIDQAEFSDDLSPRMKERFEEILREVKVIINSYLLGL